jgi:thiamine biosynthesis lipoprotein
MVDVLTERQVDTALVSASGSTIYGLGAPPNDVRGWPISVREPSNPDAAAALVFLKNMSISTSGGYEKFFWAKGRTYSHLIDPRTGHPAQGTASVSVVAPRAIDSEAWTKPAFINGRAWMAARKPSGMRVFFCGEAPRATCAWIE